MTTPFKVTSANQTVEITDALDALDACVQAVKTGKFDALGWLFEVKRKGDEDCYCSTERVCKAAGMWSES